MSSAPLAPRGASPVPATSPTVVAVKKDAADYSSFAKELGTNILALIKKPWVWSTFFAFWFFFTFFSTLLASGINSITANSDQTLHVWWVGTLLSSILLLLLFYIVYHASANLTRGMLILVLCSFIVTHVSLLLTQINLRVT
jgi:hypothetical protein